MGKEPVELKLAPKRAVVKNPWLEITLSDYDGQVLLPAADYLPLEVWSDCVTSLGGKSVQAQMFVAMTVESSYLTFCRLDEASGHGAFLWRLTAV